MHSKFCKSFLAVLMIVSTLAATSGSPASAAPTTCGGVVFQDYDADGERIEDYSHVSTEYAAVADDGVPGVSVTVTDAQGDVFTATTDANGEWSVALDTADFPIRVDFSGYPAGWNPGPVGPDAGSLNQFITNPADCTGPFDGTGEAGNASVSPPGSYCENRPEFATSCFLFGDVPGHDSEPAILTLIDGAEDDLSTNSADWRVDEYTTVATLGEVGSVYGIDTNPFTGDIYAGSFVKRHTQLGQTDNPTTIYMVPPSGAPVAWYTVDAAAADPHTATSEPESWQLDAGAFDDVGRSGLGDVELSPDGSTLYTVDLGNRQLVAIPVNPDGTADAGGVIRTDITAAALGVNSTCPNSDVRPFGLGFDTDGNLHIGAVCSAESTIAAGDYPTPNTGAHLGDETQLDAWVFMFDPASGTFSNRLDVPLPTTSRGSQNTGGGYQGETDWRPWVTQSPYQHNFIGWPAGGVTYPQPLLSDIEFDGDDITIGFMDIWGHQAGSNALLPNYDGGNGGAPYEIAQPLSAGDTVKAISDGAGGYTFPTNGTDFYYTGDNYTASHLETTLGSAAQIPGRPYTVTNSFDPVEAGATWQSGGLEWFDNSGIGMLTEGEHVRGYRLYDGNDGTFGDGSSSASGTFEKAAGVGDLQALCGPAPIEIGNRVWLDVDGDGIQDPEELPLEGVNVTLYAADGVTVIATTTTNAAGEYIFAQADGVDFNTDYIIDFDVTTTTTTLPGGLTPADLVETVADAGADGIDSDVVDNQIEITTGDPGENDHTFDAGYTPVYDLALTKVYTADNFGDTTDGVIVNGSDVTFTINVQNQGSVDATSFEVTDYLPAGFSLSDSTWTDNGDGTATYAGGALAAGDDIDITITLTADSAVDGNFVNWAEISADDGLDVDSTTDATQGNDNQPVAPGDATDGVTDNSAGPGGDDEDDHDPAPISVGTYDLALTKVFTSDTYGVTTDGIIENGSDVTFTINVENQGTIDAGSLEVTDYLPAGFVLNDAAWTDNGDGTATYAGGAVAAGDDVDITITLTADAAAAGDLVNWAEISADDGPDVDSTPDATQGNDNQPAAPGDATDDVTDNSSGPGGDDEDDHDPAPVTVVEFDLALTKVYTSDSYDVADDGIIEPLADVVFTITVINQGTIDAGSFEVTDYLPAGFTLNDTSWTDNGDGTATYSGGFLAAGDDIDIPITLTAGAVVPGSYVNWAEISSDDGDDVDSTPDDTQGNDNQPVAPGDATDGVTDNSAGPGGPDEDDHDPAAVSVANYDLALTKVYTSDDFGDTTDGLVANGSDVVFTINVENQGTIDAASFEVTDYLPAGFVLNDTTWTDNGDSTATYTGGFLAAGDDVDITITLTADAAAAGDLVNWAEISADDGNDVDSTPDATQGNDNQPAAPGDATDGVTDNSAGPGGPDEDDHDPAPISVAGYDLALTKVYTSDDFGDTTDGLVANGSDVVFTINVENQGSVEASSFEVTDYVPAGFVLNDAAWTDNGDGTATFAGGPLAAGDDVDITITLTADSAADGNFVNWAEISSDDGNDVDSTPDATQGNDNQPAAPGDATDDVTDNSAGPGGDDEDDHDPAPISVGTYDLALTKVYSSDSYGNTNDGIAAPNTDVTFTINVENQGTIDAASFEVTDYLPAGFVLNDAAWTDNGDGTATYAGAALAAGDDVDIPITLTAGDVISGEHVNWAEISADDGPDVDSTPDDTQGNDNQPVAPGDATDGVTDNSAGPAGDDEDDHDPAPITIEIYDLALTKIYTSDTYDVADDGIIEPLADVVFTINVENQGTADAGSFEVTDYLPAGFTLNDAAWTDNGDGTATYSGGFLAAGDDIDIPITVTAGAVLPGSYVNWAEISDDDGDDVDSTPDADQGNDNQPAAPGDATDGVTDNSAGPGGDDEDDHDPAAVSVANYDLALTKVFTSDTYGVTTDGIIENGSDVTFTITVINQGTIDAGSFEVTDYLPAGFVLNDAAWTDNGDGTATFSGGPLAAGDDVDIPITLTADSAAAGDLVNWAEISSDDGNDVDSTPDATQGNDNQPVAPGDATDGVTDNSAGPGGDDEDDHDPAPVTVVEFDLALTKMFTSDDFGDPTDGVVQFGTNVTFTINVENQGGIDAGSFEVTDYLPAGFVVNDAAWTDNGDGTATFSGGPLAAGDDVDIPIVLTVDTTNPGDVVNWAEISDDDGLDVDSTPDADQANDNQPDAPGDPTDNDTDNSTGPDGPDEDDHDVAGLSIETYDLALAKVYTSDTYDVADDGVVEPGADVTFTINVENQGTIDATTFTVTDTPPAGFVLNDAAWTDNGDGTYSFVGGPLAAGDNIDIPITFTVDDVGAGALVNLAEISDDDGADVDSTTDVDTTNDNQPAAPGDPTDDDTDNSAGPGGDDEDDHDIAGVTVDAYDLAIQKLYVSDTSADGLATDGVIVAGDDVTFSVTVFNQGTVDANDVVVTDYFPAGFTLNDAAWTDNGDGTAQQTIASIPAGTDVTLTITLTSGGASIGSDVNLAEISSDDGNDIDSTPNADPADDGTPVDNATDNSGGDEDDHDPAPITVAPDFDLALNKVLDTSATILPVTAGQTVTFTITVINQGTTPAQDISVIDYVDTSMWAAFDPALNAPGTTGGSTALPYTWASSGSDGLVTLVGTLGGGESVTIPVTLTIAAGADLSSLLNVAEISAATPINPDGTPMVGVPDADSTPDTDNTDPLVDDVVDGTGGDEDDHDVASVAAPTYSLGNQVWFDTNNNGMIDAGEDGIAGVTVLLFTDNDGDGVADDTDGDGVITAADAVGTSTTDADGLYLFDELEPGDYVVGIPGNQWDVGGPLYGTLSSDPTAADPDGDVDSDDDGTPVDGFVFSGGVTLGDGEPTGENPDNDATTADSNENLTVDFGVWEPIMDLALRKQLANGTNAAEVSVGDSVTFTLTVINQGDVAATNIQLIDYVPAGLTLNDPDWTAVTNGATAPLPGTLAPGASTTIDITFTVGVGAVSPITNHAEITAATPVDTDGVAILMPNGLPIPDIDSTPDGLDLEVPVDDVLDNSNGDEDDHDVAVLSLAAPTTTTTTTGTPLAFTGASSGLLIGLGLLLLAGGLGFLTIGRRRHSSGLK